MPSIQLRPILVEHQADLAALLADYLAELDPASGPAYPYLASYWEDPERVPLWIVQAEQRIGFVLLNRYALLPQTSLAIAEFYVEPTARRQGAARQTAWLLFDRFPATWEIRCLASNAAGLGFWQTTLDQYLGHACPALDGTTYGWDGTIWSFVSR
ncbi:GNAT family N-acetyltransferase [Herpetosiphon sp. NSE202]|uniref:GNAT family N-acetyltransferase n=1 Tax=Herpetosiphon sp. NSE202 TaxID=3351349 RepID=UPI00362CFD01